jgi:hypothetical protein
MPPIPPLLVLPASDTEAIGIGKNGEPPPRPAVLLPGSFNPLHAGHWGLAQAAARLHGAEVAFELSVANVDKAALSADEAHRRLAQFAGKAHVWLTRAPTFVQKARLFPGAAFVVGADTAARVVDPRYCADPQQLIRALSDLACSFLVGARVEAGGRLLRLEDLDLPEAWRPLFRPIDPAEFRMDVSSTALRGCR